MRCSVVIPTRGRLERLGECLDALTRQSAGSGTFEILVGVDGPDSGESDLTERILGERVPHDVVVMGKGRGPGATRNTLIERAKSRALLFLNDDVVPTWDLLTRHIDAQTEISAARRFESGAMVLGSAPWRVQAPDRVIDVLVRETSLVFFYDQMVGELARDHDYDWGFRHAWTLNLSVDRDAVREVGGFDEGLGAAAYEDLELAFRLHERLRMPVLYRSGAMVEHAHRYEPLDLLRREVVLGYEGYRLAEAAPACAEEVFASDLREQGAVMLARAYVAGEGREAARTIRTWLDIAEKPAEILGSDPAVIAGLFGLYRGARRYLRHVGHVTAADGGTLDEAMAWLGESGLESVG